MRHFLYPLCILLFLLSVPAPEVNAQTVYVTKTGTKYHTGSCRYLRSSMYSIELEDALGRGHGPCSVCKPPSQVAGQQTPDTQTEINTYSAPPAPKTTSQQCSATTQAGNRCKRITTNSSGRCWQHE